MNRLFGITLIACLAVGIPVSAFYVAASSLVAPGGLAASVVIGAGYVAIMLALFRALPIWPKPSPGIAWVAASLAWGGGVSVLFALIAAPGAIFMANSLGLEDYVMSFAGAIPEETIKTVGVAVIVLTFQRLSRPWHGLITGLIVGLGFEAAENVVYSGTGAMLNPNNDLAGALEMWSLRMIVGPFLHITFTAVAGWGVGLALTGRRRNALARVGIAVFWYLVAFAMHFGWNITAMDNLALTIIPKIVALGVGYPLVLAAIVQSARRARRDFSFSALSAPIEAVGALAEAESRRRRTRKNPNPPSVFPPRPAPARDESEEANAAPAPEPARG